VNCTFDGGDETVPNPVQTFEQAFGHYPEILEEINMQNFEVPSFMQCQAWPVLLKGYDLIEIAQTGTGKTISQLHFLLFQQYCFRTLHSCF
jgi:ATP-dependent RNA helicase DDX43